MRRHFTGPGITPVVPCAMALAGVLLLTAGSAAQAPADQEAFVRQVDGPRAAARLDPGSATAGAPGTGLLTAATCPGDAPVLSGCRLRVPGPETTPVPADGSVARIRQEGAGHSARVVQRGTAHFLEASMAGAHNSLLVRQHGGDGNEIRSLDLSGVGLSLSIEQDGSRLLYVDDFAFSGDGLEGSVLQEGSDLTLVQQGSWPTGFEIEQTGSGPGPGSAIRVVHVRGTIVTTPLSP